MKLELHFHTKESSPCGMVYAKDSVKMYKEAGYDGIVVTDHFNEAVLGEKSDDWDCAVDKFLEGYNEAVIAGEENGLKVLLGMELRISENGNDYLVYGVTEEFLRKYPYLYLEDKETIRKIADENGLCIIQAHPFRKGCVPTDTWFIDGVEVWNGNPRHDSQNEKALMWATENNLTQTVGSDFHRVEDLQNRCFEYDGLIENSKELSKILKS